MDDAGAFDDFAIAGVVAMLTTTVGILIVALAKTHGHIAYAIDDGGIHLSIARNLGLHGTWGVVPHHFQSASSAPLWTLLLGICARLLPRAVFEYAPFLLSTLAAAWLVVLLGREQTLFPPSKHRLFAIIAAIPVTIGLLFLPGLVMTGMEHVLHCALVVQTVALFTAAARTKSKPPIAAYVVLALAAATRFETLFVAAGIGAALLLTFHWRRVVAVGAVAAAPLVMLGIVSLAFGQQFFPNSVVAKSALGAQTSERSVSIGHGLHALGTDRAVLLLFIAAVAYLIAAAFGRVRYSVVPAIVMVVTTLLHSMFADYHWFERYQAYLIALGLFFALGAAREVLDLLPRRVGDVRIAALALILLATFAAAPKWDLLRVTATASRDTYLQRYQAGLFLAHNYDHQPVATGELGYISYYHAGPITDFFGLGDHEVLAAREHGRADATYWKNLIRRRGVHVVAAYGETLWNVTPKSWTLVGFWQLDILNVSGFDSRLQFWAPERADIEPLLRHLEEWDRRLPMGTHTEVNPFLPYKSRLPKFTCC